MVPNQRERQRERTRTAILRVAAEEFDAKGYVGTAISDIATKLELTKGSVYFHFPSKAQLAQQIVQGYFEIWDPIRAELEKTGLRGLDALEWSSREIAKHYQHDVALRAAVRLMRESALIDSELPIPFVGWMAFVTELLEQAKSDGELRHGIDIEATAWHLVSTFFGVQEVSHQLSGRSDLLQRIDFMWKLMRPTLQQEPGPT